MAGAKKYTESEPLSDKEIYGTAKPRTYREAITPEQLKLLESLGQAPSDDESAQAAADEPVAAATGGDASGPKA